MNPSSCDGTGRDLIAAAFEVTAAVESFREHARWFYYQVMLSGYACSRCHQGSIEMLKDGQCRCRSCAGVFDPTAAFQRCLQCGGAARIRVRRYECEACGEEIISAFLFDGLVFDADYFRSRMAEHREREADRRERVRVMLAGSRSPTLDPVEIDDAALRDLVASLNTLTKPSATLFPIAPREEFDLNRYEAHVKACLGAIETPFERIPPLSDDALLDRVWRFIAIVFLAHAGAIRLRQNGSTIWVMPNEVDRERQGVSGNPARADRIEGLAS